MYEIKLRRNTTTHKAQRTCNVLSPQRALLERPLHFPECNKSLSIYLFLPISSLSGEDNKKANQIFIGLVIELTLLLGFSCDMDQH